MARPQRTDVDYFPHPTRHGRKMNFIRNRYGLKGYAAWFIILEKLGETNNHFLDLNDESSITYLSGDCEMNESELLEFIEDLIKLGEFDKELWKRRILWNEKFVETIRDAYKKRSNSCITKPELLRLLNGKGLLNEDLEVPNHFEAEQDSKRVQEATKKIADFFGIGEVSQAASYIKIGNFVRYQEKIGNMELLAKQFTSYRKAKEKNGFKHSWMKYIGSPEKSYEDGAWNIHDWSKQIKADEHTTDYQEIRKRTEQLLKS